MRLFRESSSFVIGEPLSDFGMNSDRQLTAALSQFGAEASRLTDGQSQLEAVGGGGGSVSAETARALPGSVRALKKASAIRERPALRTHAESTVVMPDAVRGSGACTSRSAPRGAPRLAHDRALPG